MNEDEFRREVAAAGVEMLLVTCPEDVAIAAHAAAALRSKLPLIEDVELGPWPDEDAAA